MTIFVAQTDKHRDELAKWVSERVEGAEAGFGKPFQAVSVWRRGKLAAVAIYAGFRGAPGDQQCEITFASDDPLWCTPQTLYFILWYGLLNLDCRRMTAITRADNARVHRLLEGIGFRKEGRHPDMFKNAPGISFGMTRRWFMKEKRYGQVQSLAA